MEGVKKVAIERAIQLLASVGAKYKIIIDNEQFGGLEVVKIKPPKREPKYKRTGIKYAPIYKPVLESMQPGDCKTIMAPAGFDPLILTAATSAAAIHLWGRGNAITAKKPGGMEILRLA